MAYLEEKRISTSQLLRTIEEMKMRDSNLSTFLIKVSTVIKDTWKYAENTTKEKIKLEKEVKKLEKENEELNKIAKEISGLKFMEAGILPRSETKIEKIKEI